MHRLLQPQSRTLADLNDPTVGIDWPLQGEPNLSPKDLAGKVLAEAVMF